MYTALLTPILGKIHPCQIEEVRHSTQKERRIIDTLEPVMSNHSLIVDRSVIERDYQSTQNLPHEKALKYQLFYQLSRITHMKGALIHDDRLDALAMGVGYWVEQMAADRARLIQTKRNDRLQDELEKFMSYATGKRKETANSWLNT